MIKNIEWFAKWEIAEDLVLKLEGLKRWRAIDVSLPNLLEETKYIYPSVFLEEPFKSQIMNQKKSKFAGEYYKQVKYKGGI